MMKIDIERLKTDAAYWDDLKAPEDATHACIYLGGKWQWMKVNLSGPFNYYWHKRFSEWRRQESEVGERIIPRPTKPAEVEWDGRSAPEAGELAITSGGKCRVMGWDAQRQKVAVQWYDGEMGVISLAALKPIKTPEQRQRDELAVEIWAANGGTKDNAFTVADAILSRYNLEPKDA